MATAQQHVQIILDTKARIDPIKSAIKVLEDLRKTGALTSQEVKNSMTMLEGENGGYFKAAKNALALEAKEKRLKLEKDRLNKSTRQLRVGFLTLMYTGWKLQKMFGGMVKSVFEVLGVTQVWSAMLLTTLLPVLMPIAMFLIDMMVAIMNLPEPIQKLIGAFVLLGAIGGTIMGALGNLGLFMLGIKELGGMGNILKLIYSGYAKLFTGVAGIFKWFYGIIVAGLEYIGAIFGVTAGVVAAVIVAIVALIFGAIAAWKNNFLGFKDAVVGIWEAIKLVVKGFVDVVKGFWDIIVGIFTLNGDKIKSGLGLMGEGIKNIFKGIANFIINIINALVSLIISTLAQVVRLAQWIWNKIPGHSKVTWYEDIMAAGKDKQLIPSFQTGGVMPYTGLAMLHAGETIIPTGQGGNTGNFAPSITINATISNDYDVKRLADQLSKYWTNDFQRINKGRGMI